MITSQLGFSLANASFSSFARAIPERGALLRSDLGAGALQRHGVERRRGRAEAHKERRGQPAGKHGVRVLSSRWEGFGLVMIEAMAHGLPVIASDLPITRELLKDKDMAVLFETGNIAQLAGCMSYMADRTDWEWMGNKAVEYADTFHIEKVCDSWNNLLKKVVYGTR